MSQRGHRLFALALVLSVGCSHGARVTPDEPNPPREGPRTDAGLAPVPAPGPPGAAAPDATAVTPTTQAPNIKITVRTTPPKIWVSWGKKKLGLTPLTIERPRDSGPVDLVLRGTGFFPIHTRAYTVKNDVISVKMIKLENRMTIFGAKEELPPEVAPGDPALDPTNAATPTPTPTLLPSPSPTPSPSLSPTP